MAGRTKAVRWLDDTIGEANLDPPCEEYPARPNDPMGQRLYRTPERRYLLDFGAPHLVEMEKGPAAELLLAWKWNIPGDLLIYINEKKIATAGVILPLSRLTPDDPPIRLQGSGEPLFVGGKLKPPLSPSRYDVINTIAIEFPENKRGLSRSELRKKSGHKRAETLFYRVRNSDPDYAARLHTPGKRRAEGKGFRMEWSEEDLAIMIASR